MKRIVLILLLASALPCFAGHWLGYYESGVIRMYDDDGAFRFIEYDAVRGWIENGHRTGVMQVHVPGHGWMEVNWRRP